MKKEIIRQAKRGTLKILKGFKNSRVFECFGDKYQMRSKEPLLRLYKRQPEGPIEKLALVLFDALAKGEKIKINKHKRPKGMDHLTFILWRINEAPRETFVFRGNKFFLVNNEKEAQKILEILGEDFVYTGSF